MNKKTLILILILLILVGFAGYFFYYARNSSTVTTLRDILPFGSNSGGTAVQPTPVIPEESNIPVDNTPDVSVGELSRFRKISSTPTAGFTTFNRTRTEIVDGKKVVKTDTIIRYIERGTGNIFETRTDIPETTRLTNTTYSKIQEAFFVNTGKSLIIRSIEGPDIIKTYLADIILPGAASTSDASLGTIVGAYIDDNIPFITPSLDTQNIFVLQQDSSGAAGFTATYKGAKSKGVFSSPLGEWLPQWYGKNNIALTSKASAGVPGVLLSINTTTGGTESILSSKPGLTTLVSPTGTRILYSESSEGVAPRLYSHNKKTNLIIPLDKATFPEKCVWSTKTEYLAYCLMPISIPSAQYPDAWYQGLQSFNDSLWQINAQTGASKLIYDPTLIKISVDGIRPALTPQEDFLLFMNKKDGTVWSYSLVNPQP